MNSDAIVAISYAHDGIEYDEMMSKLSPKIQ